MVALHSVKPYIWQETSFQGEPFWKLITTEKDPKHGAIVETALARNYEKGDMDALREFRERVLARTSLDSSHIDDEEPQLVYTDLSGHVLSITYGSEPSGQHGKRTVDKLPVDKTPWPLIENPWMHQDVGVKLGYTLADGWEGKQLNITHGGETCVYKFNEPSWSFACEKKVPLRDWRSLNPHN